MATLKIVIGLTVAAVALWCISRYLTAPGKGALSQVPKSTRYIFLFEEGSALRLGLTRRCDGPVVVLEKADPSTVWLALDLKVPSMPAASRLHLKKSMARLGIEAAYRDQPIPWRPTADALEELTAISLGLDAHDCRTPIFFEHRIRRAKLRTNRFPGRFFLRTLPSDADADTSELDGAVGAQA